MKKTLLYTAAVLLFGHLLAGIGHATTISATLWAGSGAVVTSATTSPLVAPGVASTATFSVTNLDFDSTRYGGSATYDQFLSNGGANGFSGFTGDSATMVTSATTASFFQFTWTNTVVAGSYQVTHDDGFWLQAVGGSTLTFDYSVPTNPVTSTIVIPTTGAYTFTLNYAAWNGFPEVLIVDGGLINPVPEPMSIFLVGAGLVGLAVFGRRLKP